MQSNISTAVDSLVKLVNNKGRISLDNASKELGIPNNIVNEWSTFLDQEKIIHIEYKFTTPYLVSIKAGNGKEEIDYDLISRKLEAMLAFLNKTQPKDDKINKQKIYLIQKIDGLLKLVKKKHIDKEGIKIVVKYYSIYKKNFE